MGEVYNYFGSSMSSSQSHRSDILDLNSPFLSPGPNEVFLPDTPSETDINVKKRNEIINSILNTPNTNIQIGSAQIDSIYGLTTNDSPDVVPMIIMNQLH